MNTKASRATPPPNPIRAARKRARLTQQALADKLGVTKASVCHWENGRNAPDPRTALDMTTHLPGLKLEKIYAAV